MADITYPLAGRLTPEAKNLFAEMASARFAAATATGYSSQPTAGLRAGHCLGASLMADRGRTGQASYIAHEA